MTSHWHTFKTMTSFQPTLQIMTSLTFIFALIASLTLTFKIMTSFQPTLHIMSSLTFIFQINASLTLTIKIMTSLTLSFPDHDGYLHSVSR